MYNSIWNSKPPTTYKYFFLIIVKIRETIDIIYGKLKGYYNTIGKTEGKEENNLIEKLYYNVHGITPTLEKLKIYIIQNDNAIKKNIENIFILRVNRYGRKDRQTNKIEIPFIDTNRSIAFLYSLLIEPYPDFTNYGKITDEDLIEYINTGEMPYNLPEQTKWGII